MDWSAVTAEDLVDALREVDWSTPPRPVPEFFSRFTVPRSYSKWTSRLKCNLYYFAVTFNEKVTRTSCSSRSSKLKEINSYLWATSMGVCPVLFCS
nr:unnamed protein product [Digitaria exilis]